MVRLFQRHKKRKVQLLDGMWKFKTDPEKRGRIEQWFMMFPEDCKDMVVPSCWNNELGLYDYEGVAWFATTFNTLKENINLAFHGVTGQTEVYLDGLHLGAHYGGFTGFNFVIRNLTQGDHKLVVSVDNTHDNMNTIPLAMVDWFHYGGITRSVEVMELEDVWIKDSSITYILDEYLEDAQMNFDVILEGLRDGEYSRKLNVYINDQIFYTISIHGQGESHIKISKQFFRKVKLWDTRQPHLYHVRFEIEEDDIIERIGFREIKVENKKLFLNKREIYLKGVNRHEDHPDWGFAIPLKLMKKDIDIINNLGCNSIRGSHYPNSPVFLDYCDQEGLLFWEEIPVWQYMEAQLNNSVVLQRGLKMLEEMVKRDCHHPSIIIWGMHNECNTSIKAGYNLTKAFVDKVRSMDNTRPLTYATDRPLEDSCFSLVDIVSINMYLGWYRGTLEDWIDFIKELKAKLLREDLSHLPIIISEFGAGAIYGDCTFEGEKWTENYQEKYLDFTIRLFYNMPEIVGSFIWQYCDIRSAKELELLRPRSFNNKGLVNEYRKPKMAYWKVREVYKSIE